MRLGDTWKAHKEGWHSCSVSWQVDRERLLRDIAKLEAEMGRLEAKYDKVCSLNRDFQSNVEKATRTPSIYVGGH